MERKGRERQKGENGLTWFSKYMENISMDTFSCQLFSELYGGLWKQNNLIFRKDGQVCRGMCCVIGVLREKDLCGSEHHIK